MATKTFVIVNGEAKPMKAKMPIICTSVITSSLTVGPTKSTAASEYDFVELVCKDYIKGSDLMFAYDASVGRSCGALLIGQWNDGVAE